MFRLGVAEDGKDGWYHSRFNQSMQALTAPYNGACVQNEGKPKGGQFTQVRLFLANTNILVTSTRL